MLDPISDIELDGSVVDRFGAVVEAVPDNIAVLKGGITKTYREIDRESDSIAAAVDQFECRYDLPIIVSTSDITRYIPAILGILKTGRFYVSLDPASLPQRQRLILQASESSLSVTDRDCSNGGVARETLGVGDELILDEIADAQYRRRSISPGDRYCIYFTSGSSGQPKGVVHSHRALLSNIQNYSRELGISTDDRISLLASTSLSASSSDVFGALLNGATLAPYNFLGGGVEDMTTWIAANKISVYHSTPSLFKLLLTRDDDGSLDSLRAVKLGGEPLPVSVLRSFQSRFTAHCRLINGLGMTEAAGNVSYFSCFGTATGGQTASWQSLDFADMVPADGIDPDLDSVPVGYATPGKSVAVLDDRGHPVAHGVVGEIAVTSKYLASGYWRDAELTTTRFHEHDGLTTFFTGDRGRMLPDNCLVHVGRSDRIVKIRGFRVSLDEVERALDSFEDVLCCAAIASRGSEDLSIGVVVAAADPKRFAGDALARRLEGILPSYSWPTTVAVVEALPRLANGKIDYTAIRRRLNAGSNSIAATEADVAAAEIAHTTTRTPSTETEKLLVSVWKSLLKKTPSIDDDFFDIGGHSLLAARMFAELERKTGVFLPVSTIFTLRTIGTLARQIDAGALVRSKLVSIQPAGSKPPIVCVHDADSTLLLFNNLSRHLGPNYPVFGLEGEGLDGNPIRYSNVEEMAAEYVDVLVSRVKTPFILCAFCKSGTVALEIEKVLRARGIPVEFVVLIDWRSPQVKSGVPLSRLQKYIQVLKGSGPSGEASLLQHVRKSLTVRGQEFMRHTSRIVQKIFLRLERPIPTRFRLTPIMDTNLSIFRTYEPGPIHSDLVVLRSSAYKKFPPDLGWAAYSRARIDLFDVSGPHDVLREPYVKQVAEILAKRIDEAVHSS